MPNTIRLLIVDPEPARTEAICEAIAAHGYASACLTSATEALDKLREEPYDLVLTDLTLPEMSGADFLRAAIEIDPDLVGIVMTEPGIPDKAVAAMQAGALDYLVRPFEIGAALSVLARALQVRRLRLENVQLQQAVGIYDLSMGIRLTLDFATVLEKVAHAAMGYVHVCGVSLLLPAEDGKSLRVALAQGENSGPEEGARIPFGPVLSAWVEKSLERKAHPDQLSDARNASSLALTELPGGSSIPMLAGGTFIGILHFTSRNPGRTESAAQVKALNILAGAAAAALEAALLLEQLRTAERRYRSLSESAADIIVRYDLFPAPHIGYVNPAVTGVVGYTPEEFYADPGLYLRVVHPEDRHLLEAMLDGVASGPSTVTVRCIHRDGKTVWIEQRNRLVRDTDGRLIAFEGIARDVTARKQMEEQLRQSQKMEAIGLLAGGVAHDFNNLLTVILGYSDLILVDDAPCAAIVEKLSQIMKAAEQAATLTQHLLAFGRRQAIRPVVLNLNTIITGDEMILRRLVGDDIELASILSPRLTSVEADGGQMEQILMNLIMNAKGAMPQGGKITIETKNVEASGAEGKTVPQVMLSVTDTGHGMDAETQARIFEPFYTTKDLGKGTGLGLSIVYGIVKRSGGTIRVVSESGQGARFEILLPGIEAAAEVPVPVPQSAADVTRSGTILVVEDDPRVSNLVSTILRKAGYEMLMACDGNDAMRICKQQSGKIALVLTDMIMPGMGGSELVESLRHSHKGIRLIYMSGYAGDAINGQGKLDPSIPFLQKPFTPAALIAKVRETLTDSPIAHAA